MDLRAVHAAVCGRNPHIPLLHASCLPCTSCSPFTHGIDVMREQKCSNSILALPCVSMPALPNIINQCILASKNFSRSKDFSHSSSCIIRCRTPCGCPVRANHKTPSLVSFTWRLRIHGRADQFAALGRLTDAHISPPLLGNPPPPPPFGVMVHAACVCTARSSAHHV